MPIETTGVTGSTVWGGPVGAVRQHVSGKHYELAICNGRGAGFDMARIASSMHGMTRQTAPAWVDVGSAGLCPGAGLSEQDPGIAKVMHSAYPGQYC